MAEAWLVLVLRSANEARKAVMYYLDAELRDL